MLRFLLALLLTVAARPLAAQDEAVDGGYRYEESDVIRNVVTEVMSRPEFARLRTEPPEPADASETPQWLERFLDWLARVFRSSDEESPPQSIELPGIELVLYAMAALVVLAAIGFILKSVVSARRERQLDSKDEQARVFRAGKAPGETEPQHYWERAQAFAEQRQFKKAIGELLLGAMSALERQGRVRYRRGLTNRDYLRAARGVARESLGTIVTVFEHVYFGRREATADGFRTCSREFQKSFLGGAP